MSGFFRLIFFKLFLAPKKVNVLQQNYNFIDAYPGEYEA